MLIIESDHYAAAGIETMFFPDGQPHAKCTKDLGREVLLVLKMRDWESVGLGACVKNMLEQQMLNMQVFIPYFPGARQDRCDGHAPYTLGMMAKLFNTLGPTATYVLDIHSTIARSKVLPMCNFMPKDLRIEVPDDVVGVIAPDEGAAERAASFRDAFCPAAELLECKKVRDPHTGWIVSYEMPRLKRGGGYIIVDDICDGGATFNLLAKAFHNDPLGPSSWLEMFVSHGIFSKGLDAIDQRIRKITTTDSWCWLQHPRLQVLPLVQLYPQITGEPRA